ncbi:MAG: leucyl/phenylalanyl-tRNA--protein transferase [Proteobacteria bacterium]|nr:leucyl/phenylalanyl-tRNA--protein transferase [Pseudomonadota bacterium]
MPPVFEVTPELVLRAYSIGVFPMAESGDDPELYWIDPERRGILPLEGFHVSRRLSRTVRANPYEVRVDSAFDAVIAACSEPVAGRPETWINRKIRVLYGELFRRGYAHSVECWRDGRLQGGLYGVALGGAFFGESMFTRARDASKVALVHLVARLKVGGFSLLDTQFVTKHLTQFGAVEIARGAYLERLDAALKLAAEFPREIDPERLRALLAEMTRTPAPAARGRLQG